MRVFFQRELTILKKSSIQTILFAIVSFILLLSLWNQPVFTSDEPEIFIKGIQISRGQFLYRDVDSQHMPLMYHLAAIMARLGVSTLTGFRISFYVLYSIILGFIYCRYHKEIGWRSICLYLISYLSLIPTIRYGTTVISEQLQGLGMVILLYELLAFEKRRELTGLACFSISLAVFISFGSAFVSIFGVFAFFVGILAIRIIDDYKNGMQKGIKRCFTDLFLLCASIIAPFFLYLFYFVRTGTVRELFQWAYVFNREVYPKYLSLYQGYGNNVLGALLGGISNIAKTFNIADISTVSLIHIVTLIITIFYIIELIAKDRVLAIVVGFFIVTCATRDGFEFHGIPVVAVFSAIMGLEFNAHYKDVLCWASNSKKLLVVIVFGIIFCSAYLSEIRAVFYIDSTKYYNSASEEYALRILGEENEEVGYFNVNHELLLRGKKLPANPTWGVCPWFWEWERSEIINTLYD